MTNRIGPRSIRRDVPQPSGSIQAAVVRTPSYHYAAARGAESAARALSDEIAGHNALARSTGIAWEKAADAKAARDSLHLLVAAHRSAAYRMERPQRIRYRLSVLTYPAHRVLNRVRRFRNELRQVSV